MTDRRPLTSGRQTRISRLQSQRALAPVAAPLGWRAVLSGLRRIPGADQARRVFEAELCSRFGATAAYTVASGSAALRLILEAVKQERDRPPRTRVILPAYTCPILVTVVREAGLEAVFCDLRPESLDFDHDHLGRLVDGRTLAIIQVHLLGLPRDISQAVALAESAGAILIEDAAQALGAQWRNQTIGTRTPLGCISFGPGKPFSLGGGGAIFINDPRWQRPVEQLLARLSEPSWRASAAILARLLLLEAAIRPAGYRLASRLGFRDSGNQVKPYQMQRLSGVQARIGVQAISRLEHLNDIRRRNGERLSAAFSHVSGIRHIEMPAEAQPSYLRFPLLIEDPHRRDHLLKRFWQAGIGAGRMYQALPAYFPDLTIDNCPGADYVSQRLLVLPTHAFVRPEDVETMVSLYHHS